MLSSAMLSIDSHLPLSRVMVSTKGKRSRRFRAFATCVLALGTPVVALLIVLDNLEGVVQKAQDLFSWATREAGLLGSSGSLYAALAVGLLGVILVAAHRHLPKTVAKLGDQRLDLGAGVGLILLAVVMAYAGRHVHGPQHLANKPGSTFVTAPPNLRAQAPRELSASRANTRLGSKRPDTSARSTKRALRRAPTNSTSAQSAAIGPSRLVHGGSNKLEAVARVASVHPGKQSTPSKAGQQQPAAAEGSQAQREAVASPAATSTTASAPDVNATTASATSSAAATVLGSNLLGLTDALRLRWFSRRVRQRLSWVFCGGVGLRVRWVFCGRFGYRVRWVFCGRFGYRVRWVIRGRFGYRVRWVIRDRVGHCLHCEWERKQRRSSGTGKLTRR